MPIQIIHLRYFFFWSEKLWKLGDNGRGKQARRSRRQDKIRMLKEVYLLYTVFFINPSSSSSLHGLTFYFSTLILLSSIYFHLTLDSLSFKCYLVLLMIYESPQLFNFNSKLEDSLTLGFCYLWAEQSSSVIDPSTNPKFMKAPKCGS